MTRELAVRRRSLSTVRIWIGAIAVSLLSASSIHFGLLIQGYRDQQAATAEAVIGTVMLVGLGLTWAPGPWSRRAAVGTLAFGLLGALVGLFTVVIGVGPRTLPDIVYHVALVAASIAALVTAIRLVGANR